MRLHEKLDDVRSRQLETIISQQKNELDEIRALLQSLAGG